MNNKTRCKWCNLQNLRYIKYHDEEWCQPNFNDQYLFSIWVSCLLTSSSLYAKRFSLSFIFILSQSLCYL